MISIARRCVVPLWVLIAAVWGGSAMAATQSFQVPLVGSQEVPSVETAGMGMAELSYDPATRMVTWTITYAGLSGPVTMAHFHGPAAKGESAAPQVWSSSLFIAGVRRAGTYQLSASDSTTLPQSNRTLR